MNNACYTDNAVYDANRDTVAVAQGSNRPTTGSSAYPQRGSDDSLGRLTRTTSTARNPFGLHNSKFHGVPFHQAIGVPWIAQVIRMDVDDTIRST
jgi:hypothetical protein